MNHTAEQYDRARRPLTALLEQLPATGWADPSPCPGWSRGDVVRHLVQTQREFLSGQGLELGEAPGASVDPVAVWRAHAERVAALLADDAVPAARYDGYFGPTTVGASFEQFYVWDMLVHRWDLAGGSTVEAGLTEAELDRIEAGADSFGDALYLDGICQPAVEPAPGADRAARVLARLGRS